MKTKILITVLLTLYLTGCSKQQTDDPKVDQSVKAQFEKSDAIISGYLDKLDASTTPIEEKKQIICQDFPTEYKTNYMPALLKEFPKEYTETSLLNDLNNALNYYKGKDSIQC